MIGGSELQELFRQADSLQEEIAYTEECMENANDADYWSSPDRFRDDMTQMEDALDLVILEIENYGGTYERS